MTNSTIPRTPWPTTFPEIVVHSSEARRNEDADFVAAKSGDLQAALRLAVRLISPEATIQLALADCVDAMLLPVTALETTGFNAIPDAMARLIGAFTGYPVLDGVIVQANRVGHTRSTGWHRIVTPAVFEGPVEPGRNYILVDDHVGLGGTLANLRGHVEAGGGRVVAMTTLSESRDARTIAVRPNTLSLLRLRHGQELEDFWQAVFGHSLDCLTNVEAAYLARQLSVEIIGKRMAAAAEQARRRGLPTIVLQAGG